MRYICSLLLGYLLTCPAYAYIIGSTLKIQNDTEQSLTLHITQPNEGAPLLEQHLAWKDNPCTQCDKGNKRTCIWTDGTKHFYISSSDPAEIIGSLNRRMRKSPLRCSSFSPVHL